MLRHQTFAEGEARDRPDRRPFLLCRSGGPGMQFFGAAAWSGDVDCSFATLEEQVAVGLNMAMSGVPYWGTDIGGFYQVGSADPELFVRWFQFGAFCPVFRAHGHSWRDHLPWAHGAEVEAICRRYLELRYRLMPYTYTLAWQAHREGLPLMRPVPLADGADPGLQQVGTQYLWGDDLLVAPVTRAGATHWPVQLPAGTWYDFWTQQEYDGPRAISVEAPLDRLPLFVRAGAMIPLAPVRQFDGDPVEDEITLLVYPAERGAAVLYEDDGISGDYRDGACAVTSFALTRHGDCVQVHIGKPVGQQSAAASERRYSVQVYARRRPRSVSSHLVPNHETSADTQTPLDWSYDGTFVRICLDGKAREVELLL